MQSQLVPYSDDSSSGESCLEDGPIRPCKLRRVGEAVRDTAVVGEAEKRKMELSAQGPKLLRVFPHQEGIFAFTVYIPVTLNHEVRLRHQALFDRIKQKVPSLQNTKWNSSNSDEQGAVDDDTVSEEQHISLSRTLGIRYAQVEGILSALRHEFAKLRPFVISLSGLECLSSDAGVRLFVCNMVRDGKEKVCRLVAKVDRAIRPHGLQTFHEDPRPHISFAWDTGSQLEAVQSAVDDIDTQRQSLCAQNPDPTPTDFSNKIDRICCLVGQKQHTLWQSTEPPESS